MRRYLVLPLAAAVLGAMLAAGGCVSKAEYDRVLALNRLCNQELEKTQAALRQLRGENENLQQDLNACHSNLQAKDQQLAILQRAKDDLQQSFDQLQAAYKKLAGREPLVLEGPMLPGPVHEALMKFAAENPDLVEYDAKRGMVKFKSDLTFDKGSDYVKEEAVQALRKFVEILDTPAAAKFHVYIAGHTDDIPIAKPQTKRRHPNNWYLSVHRAVAVLLEMQQAGLRGERLAAMGFGEYHPIAPNAPNNRGNPLNRRVEIWVVPPDRFLTVASGSIRGEDTAGPEK